MKRYRVLNMDFDLRANMLTIEPTDEWTSAARESHEQARADIRQGLVAQYGLMGFEQKLANFVELGAAPVSVVAFHNAFYAEARTAFVVGAYYPALTGVCSLGERVLNHLVLRLRDHFDDTPEYQQVYRKKSFDKWDVPIGVLQSWGILREETVVLFHQLKEVRNRSIHFNPETDAGARAPALEAMTLFRKIIEAQFSAFGQCPWLFIHAGMSFVMKASENEPFVREVVLPNCHLVGPRHRLEGNGMPWRLVDDQYPEVEVTDEEFVRLFDKLNR